jgi:hypothetical protein
MKSDIIDQKGHAVFSHNKSVTSFKSATIMLNII